MKPYRFERELADTSGKSTLLIGTEGCGKTTFAHQLMEGRILTLIDTTYLKDPKRLTETLGNLGKRNISQMLGQISERGIIFERHPCLSEGGPTRFRKDNRDPQEASPKLSDRGGVSREPPQKKEDKDTPVHDLPHGTHSPRALPDMRSRREGATYRTDIR